MLSDEPAPYRDATNAEGMRASAQLSPWPCRRPRLWTLAVLPVGRLLASPDESVEALQVRVAATTASEADGSVARTASTA